MGAVIMKMIRRTSTMSMNGTMLISEREVCVDLEREGILGVHSRQLKVKSETHLNAEIKPSWSAAVLRPYGERVMAKMADQIAPLAEGFFDLGRYFQCKRIEALGQIFYVLQ